MTRPRALLSAAVAAFAAGMSALAVLQQQAFETGRFDVGNLTQAVWSTAHGRFLEMTDLQGARSRASAPLRPACGAARSSLVAVAEPRHAPRRAGRGVALGAVPVFLLARKHLGGEWSGPLFALVYLLYPPTQWLVVDDFHPVALATPLLLGAIWFLDENRLLPFALCAVAACLTKEQVGLVVAMLGIWHAFAHGRRRAGLVIFVTGTLVAVIATAVIIPHYAPGGGSPFAGRYDAVGGSPGGIVKTAAIHPLRLLQVAFEGRDIHYLWDLLAPLGALPLLAPLVALTALPEIVLNILSSTRTQPSIHYHYTAGAIPGLIAGAVLGGARLRRLRPEWWPWLGRGLVALVLVAGIVMGPLPVWRHVPFGSTLAARDHIVSDHDRAAARVIGAVPGDAAVSATNTLGAHLSERRRIFSFPVLREARWVAVDLKRPSYLDDATGKQFAAAYAHFRQDSHWRVVRAEDGVIVLHKPAGWPAGASDRDRLGQQVRTEREHRNGRDGVLLGSGHRDGPRQVPDCKVGGRHEHEAGGKCEPRSTSGGAAGEEREPHHQRRDRDGEGEVVGEPELLQPVRDRVTRLEGGVADERKDRKRPGAAVEHRGADRDPDRRAGEPSGTL